MPTNARGRLVTRPRWISTAAVLTLALLTLILPATASAHPSLVQSSPLGGISTETVPREVRLALTEDVIPRGSSIEVRRIGSAPEGRVLRAAPRQAGSSGLSLALPKLPPSVYEVRWVALGSDGHTTAGSFRFGVSGKGGSPPPGAERLSGPGSTATGGRGDEDAASDGTFATIVRWLGLLGVSALLGGALLRRLERRAEDASDERVATTAGRAAADLRWRRVAALGLTLALFGAAEAVAVLATAGIGDPSFALLTNNANGRVALARLVLIAVIGIPALRAAAWRRKDGALPRADGLLLAAGAVGILGYGIDGHVQGGTGSQLFPTLVGGLHGLAAGVWLGGLIGLVLLGGDRVRAFKAYAPAAVGATAVLAITGTIAALREVDGWYFLRWSDYGRLLLIKIVLAIAAVVLGGLTWRRLRASDDGTALPTRSRRVLRVEAGLAILVVAAASILAGLVPGRGQPVAAQRGNLLGGPALATASSDGDLLRVTIAPATPGPNRLVIEPTGLDEGPSKTTTRGISVRLRCACARGEVRATLRKGRGDAWSTDVTLPAAGTWFAYTAVTGRAATSPVALTIGDTAKGGPKPRLAIQTADLSGPESRRCRAQAQGVALGIGRLNAAGGLDGHRKLVLRTVDDGGSPARAATAVKQALTDDAVILAAPCGEGAGGAIRAAGDLPTVVGDPSAPIAGGRHTYRLAEDPRDEGLALGGYIADQGFRLRTDAPRRVSLVRVGRSVGDADQLAGLREGLKPAKVTLDEIDDPTEAEFRRATRPDRVVSTVITGDRRRLAQLLDALGGRATAPVLAGGALFDERLIIESGAAGLQGTVSSPSWVRLNSRDGEAYSTIIPLLFPGERPSIAGLQGYATGLALNEGLKDGSDPAKVAARLDRPRGFTDVITSPWLSTARTRGAPLFTIVKPTFLPENLIPSVVGGGGSVSGRYFVGGSWSPLEGAVYGAAIPGGPDLGAPKTPVLPGPGAPGPPGGTPIPETGGVKAP
ncbi:ABC transporter substrate-binding protein [Patulibacter sp. NPDC049589]|uniref:ABC transporter substrate-binding protein n=1 Tax=Patulibacter sp. NPDC049589 TaxID=3154731 RepID=UPI0034220BE1